MKFDCDDEDDEMMMLMRMMVMMMLMMMMTAMIIMMIRLPACLEDDVANILPRLGTGASGSRR